MDDAFLIESDTCISLIPNQVLPQDHDTIFPPSSSTQGHKDASRRAILVALGNVQRAADQCPQSVDTWKVSVLD